MSFIIQLLLQSLSDQPKNQRSSKFAAQLILIDGVQIKGNCPNQPGELIYRGQWIKLIRFYVQKRKLNPEFK